MNWVKSRIKGQSAKKRQRDFFARQRSVSVDASVDRSQYNRPRLSTGNSLDIINLPSAERGGKGYVYALLIIFREKYTRLCSCQICNCIYTNLLEFSFRRQFTPHQAFLDNLAILRKGFDILPNICVKKFFWAEPSKFLIWLLMFFSRRNLVISPVQLYIGFKTDQFLKYYILLRIRNKPWGLSTTS